MELFFFIGSISSSLEWHCSCVNHRQHNANRDQNRPSHLIFATKSQRPLSPFHSLRSELSPDRSTCPSFRCLSGRMHSSFHLNFVSDSSAKVATGQIVFAGRKKPRTR